MALLAAGEDQPQPEGLWVKCPSCTRTLFKRLVEERLDTCPECHHHFPMTAARRVGSLVDAGTWEELDAGMSSGDPLAFVDTRGYPERLAQFQAKAGMLDAVLCGRGKLAGKPLGLGAMDFAFNGGSLGSVVGEKLTRLVERCTRERIPVVIVSASGGVRMQEGAFGLMQMAKTSAALARHAEARLPYISVLTNPTIAGVMASFAALGDVIIAEPKALIGFASPRFIRAAAGRELPEGFQTSEFLREHGHIDLIVARAELRDKLRQLLGILGGNAVPAQRPWGW